MDEPVGLRAFLAAREAGRQAREAGWATGVEDPNAWRAMLEYTRTHPDVEVVMTWRGFLCGVQPDAPDFVPPQGWYVVPGLDTPRV